VQRVQTDDGIEAMVRKRQVVVNVAHIDEADNFGLAMHCLTAPYIDAACLEP
jgi:hypothetical protein